jgi:hypothetical protein
MARQRGATDPRDLVYSLLGFVDAMPVEVDYRISVAQLYRSLVMNFIRRDKNLNILTMCRNFDPDKDGGHQNTDERLTGETTGGLDYILQLLVLNVPSMLQGHASEEPGTEHGDGSKAHAVETTSTQAYEGSKETKTEVATKSESTADRDESSKDIATTESTRGTENSHVGVSKADQNLPSWVPRWNINEIHASVQIALDPRRTASCSSSGPHSAQVTFSKSGDQLTSRGMLVDVVDCCCHEAMVNYQNMMRNIVTAQQNPYQLANLEATWQRFQQEWSAWERFTNDHQATRYQNVDDQREAYVDSVMMGLDVGGDQNLGSYYNLLAVKLDWPYKDANAGDSSTWRSDALVDSQKHTFFMTKTGFMGRGPRTIRAGDVICILYGGRIPFALRPSGSEFHLLGECCGFCVDCLS